MAHDMFIKMTGVTGGSKDKAMSNTCDILSFTWGMAQSGSRHVGGGGGAGKVFVHDMTFTKYSDKASGTIMQFCCNGKHIPEAVLTVRRAGGNPVEEITMTMTDVIVTSVSAGGSGGDDRFTETVTLNFAKVIYKANGQTASGGVETGANLEWDIVGNSE